MTETNSTQTSSDKETLSRTELIRNLNLVLNGKLNSLAAYVLEARPYQRPSDAAVLQIIRDIAKANAGQAERLGLLIERLDGVPWPGIFDIIVADINYLSVAYLARLLATRLSEQIAAQERFASEATSLFPNAAQHLKEISKEDRSLLERLQSTLASSSETTSESIPKA